MTRTWGEGPFECEECGFIRTPSDGERIGPCPKGCTSTWIEVKDAPEKPSYALCNQGHDLVLIRNDKDALTWDCPVCIFRGLERQAKAMKEDREEVCNCGHDLMRHNGFSGDGEPFHCVDCDCKAFKRHAGSLDLEPTWMQILGMVEHGVVPARELEKACVLADTVRQAQKKGESITINPDNSVVIDDHKEE